MQNRRRFLIRGAGAMMGLAAGGLAWRGWAQDGGRSMITQATQDAIDAGLAYLARSQNGDGSFGTNQHTGNVATFRSDQRAWYEAYERDLDGQPIDDVMDWAAMEQDVLGQDKALATLLVLAAEAVKYDRRAPDYWTAERRWQAGDTTTLVQQSTDKVRRALAS